MKPFPFDYERPRDLREAARLLADGGDGARVMAGGQSLGPMLNLRLARPSLLVDVTHIPELTGVETSADAITIGAAVTHAAIEDRRIPDIGQEVLFRIAGGIAYRAVRNRGTIGGSIAHADPAADWVTALTALGASVVTYCASDGGRTIPLDGFFLAGFVTALKPGEILRAIRVPRLSASARWGWYKITRKPGEFASAIGAVLSDPSRSLHRAVIGATGGPPVLLRDVPDPSAMPDDDLARALPGVDAIDRKLYGAAMRRATALARQ